MKQIDSDVRSWPVTAELENKSDNIRRLKPWAETVLPREALVVPEC